MTGSSNTGPRARLLAAAVLSAMLLLALLAGSASADTATLTFTDAAGKLDPVADVGRTMTLAGNATVAKRVFIRVRPAGGAPCAPSASSDSGDDSWPGFSGDTFNGTSVNGDFKLQKTGVWPTAGTYLFCIWLAEYNSTSTTPISQVITFRAPTGTISATVAPATVALNQTATVTITGSTESPKRVFATAKLAGGAPCAVSYNADNGRTLLADRQVDGAFTLTATTTLETPGAWVVCLWLADSASDAAPVAGPQTATFTVAPPPPPCVVPTVVAGEPLAQATARVAAAACSVGTIRTVPSARYPRGSVFRFSPQSGEKLDNNGAVDVYVSDGPRCVVPSVPRSRSVAATRARLNAAGCTAGRVVRRASSRYRRGRVIRLSRAAGKRLAPRATVDIVVSRGRR